MDNVGDSTGIFDVLKQKRVGERRPERQLKEGTGGGSKRKISINRVKASKRQKLKDNQPFCNGQSSSGLRQEKIGDGGGNHAQEKDRIARVLRGKKGPLGPNNKPAEKATKQ